MTVKTVKLSDLAKEIEGFTGHALEEQKAAVVAGLYRTIPHLAQNSPVDTGQYANSWEMTHDEKQAMIGNFAPHAPIIEYGARPFTPPIGPLLAWAKRVLQDPSQPPEYSDRVWALAKATQAKIAAVGMTPKLILTDAYDEMLKNIKAELDRVEL